MPPRSARDLRRSLEALLSRLERLRSPLGLEDAGRVSDAAMSLLNGAEAPLTGDLAALANVLVRVGPRLEALNPLIAAGLTGGDAGAVLAHLTLASSLCWLYGSCWRMAGRVPYSSAQAQQLGRGALLIADAGRLALERTAAALPAGPLRSKQLRDHSYCLLFAMRHELRFAAVQPGGGGAEFRGCALLDQVPPEQALSLLAAIAEAVGPDKELSFGWVQHFSTAMHALTVWSCRHQPVLQNSPSLQATLLGMLSHSMQLLASLLPGIGGEPPEPSGSIHATLSFLEDVWQTLAQFAASFGKEWMSAAVRQASQRGNRLAKLLPVLVHLSYAPLPEASCLLSTEQLEAATRRQLAARVHMRLAVGCIATALPVGDSDSSTPNPLSEVLLVSTALELLPGAAAATQRLLEEEQLFAASPSLQGQQASASDLHDVLIIALLRLGGRAMLAFPPHAAACAAAATQVLSLLPLALRQQRPFERQNGFALMAGQAAHLLHIAGAGYVEGNAAHASLSALAPQLAQANVTACRLVHSGMHAAVEQRSDSDRALFALIVASVSAAVLAAADLHDRRAALAAATVEALLVLGSRMSARAFSEAVASCFGTGGATDSNQEFATWTVRLAAMYECTRVRVHLLFQLATSALTHALRHSQVSASTADSTACSTGAQQTLEIARHGSLHTLAAMVSTGLLAALIEAGVQTQQNQHDLTLQVRMTLVALSDGAASVALPGHSLTDGAAAGQQPLPADLAARLAGAQRQVAALLAATAPEQLLGSFAEQVQPAAAELAAALQTYWQLPEQRAAAELALAQAAAGRSCAYLRCANLGAEGGAAAGEGAGSMRCSACRAVWYCSTACSHADWRAGHKRVCKALGAARQAEKEEQRRQQQEGQGQQHR